MGCIEVHIKRVPSEIVTSAKKSGTICASTSPVADGVSAICWKSSVRFSAQADVFRWGSFVGTEKIGSVYAWSSIVCTPGIGPEPVIPDEKYLEIEPTLLWVYEDLETFNKVFSNVTWNIM